MHKLSQIPDPPTLIEYKQLLRSDWTRLVACQNQCLTPNSCRCTRYIIHVDALQAWWKRTLSVNTGHTKLKQLLDELPLAAHQLFPLVETSFTGPYSCLNVFSLLLSQGRGHLIDQFCESNMIDMYLDIVRGEIDQNLRLSLAKVVPRSEVDHIIDEFEKERWAYAPLKLTLHMDRQLQGSKVIPPFCYKQKLGEKGGTASIYWVAVQEDLISDEGLKDALHDSLYHDEKFGWCYQMVLKSYCGIQENAYNLEKKAFSGLNSTDEVPIVRYLGCFTHEYGEGRDKGKTYNLLLEYGDRDLYDSWQDETNLPPVRAEPIIRFWESLFKVADAIRHVHNLQVSRGKSAPLRFNGWHADIKPDNILIVRGQLKLADFGFARFAPAVQGQDGTAPTELIDGFTDTYGAPEVSSKRQDGTLSGVTQSIDTWSYGCVLSVAATWVVLGFQGIRQYGRLRQLAPTNIHDTKTYDRFHDGIEVLPEIKKWHNYLRGHLRSSDTMTPLVLDLIELNMLQTKTRDRLDLEQLCQKLRDITDWATQKMEKLDVNSKYTDEMVLMALSKVEEEAHIQESSEQKDASLQEQSMVLNVVTAPNPRQRASRQIRKANFLNSRPFGRTTNRKEIPESELINKPVVKEEDKRLVKGVYDDPITESPTHTEHPSIPFQGARKDKRMNPDFVSPLVTERQIHVSAQPYTSSHRTTEARDIAQAPQPVTNGYSPVPQEYVQDLDSQRLQAFQDPRRGSESTRPANQQHFMEQQSPLAHFATYPAQSTNKSDRPNEYPQPPSSAPAVPSPFTYTRGSLGPLPTSPYHTPIKTASAGGAHSPTQLPTVHRQFAPPTSQSVPQIKYPIPRNSQPSYVHHPTHWEQPSPTTPLSPAPAPSIMLMEPAELGTSRGSPKTIYSGTHSAEKQPVTDVDYDGSTSVVRYATLPNSVYQLPFDVCRAREHFEQPEQPVSKGIFNKLRDKLGHETQKADASFAETFSDRRELIFVVDNGATMFEHWPIVVFVAETLMKKAAGLDKDGIDLRFTVGGREHNQQNLKGNTGRKLFRQTLDKAWPANTQNEYNSTDMDQTLGEVLKHWRKSNQPATTLLVLTDGIWPKTVDDAIQKTIIQFAYASAEQHVGRRHFSIQFIRFGEFGHKRLQWLDDNLCNVRNLKDIIDHCSWRATINKMLTGSIEAYEDQRDAPEPPIEYNYRDLVELFALYNKESSKLLSPQSPPQTLSRSSSRGSNRKHESTPPPRRESWNSQHRKTFSG